MATIVLVPGFWLGAWAWEDVAQELTNAGHAVYPVTLTGLADRAAEATPEVDVEAHITDVLRVIADNNLRQVVLVGHSGANMPVTGAADRLPERLARVVYVDTGPLPDGMANIDFSPPEAQEELRKRVAEEGDGWKIPVPPFDPAADPVNLAELSEEHLAALRERATPQPFGTATQPLRRPSAIPPTPKTVIATTFTPEQIRELAASGNPIFGLMADMEIMHLPTGHWPMFSRPRELATLIDQTTHA
jgi:pimeloyl-ACP methyl ester carboxylesterase